MSKGLIAWAAGIAALVVLAVFWMSDSTSDSASFDDTEMRVTKRRPREERGAVAGAPREQRPGARTRNDAADDSAGSDETTERGDRASARRRRPAALDAGQRPGAPAYGGRRDPDSAPAAGSSRRNSQIAGGGGPSGGGGITRSKLPAEGDSREAPKLPEASNQPAPQDDADGAPAPPAEPIPEVAYEQDADRLFDTGVPMEVQGAGRISPDAGMVSFWIQPEWAHNKDDSADFMRLGETGLELVKEGNFLRFQYVDAQGAEQGGDADIGHWQDGEWHHVIASWTREGMYLYLDGGQAFANQGGARPPAGRDPGLFVGSAFPDGTGVALAAMANLTVINRPAAAEEVLKMFAAGGPTKK